MNTLEDMTKSAASRKRPMIGLTILVVEDSRFACEALRIICLRSGARIRRADCLGSARRHLTTYRPNVMIVDIGLPDGSGIDLIREVKQSFDIPPVILATSGDDLNYKSALTAGASGFLSKPLESIHEFQSVVLRHFPGRPALHIVQDPGDPVEPDELAYRDDLCHAQILLQDGMTPYVSTFIQSVATSAKDHALLSALNANDAQRLDQTLTSTIQSINPF